MDFLSLVQHIHVFKKQEELILKFEHFFFT